MKKNRIGYIVLLLCAIGFSIGLRARLSSITLIVAILMPIISLIIFISTQRKITVDIPDRTVTIHKMAELKGQIIITNASAIPFTQIRIVGLLPDEKGRNISKQRIIMSVLPRTKVKINAGIIFDYRGEYSMRIDYIDLYDIFGIFHRRRKLDKEIKIKVVPRVFDISPVSESSMTSDTNPNPVLITSDDRDELSSIREYRDGDLLRSVHWKLSAKKDDLIVKVLDGQRSTESAVIMDLNCYYEDMDSNLKVTDAVIESALTICNSLLTKGQNCLTIWYDAKAKVIAKKYATPDSGFAEVFDTLSLTPIWADPINILNLLASSADELNMRNSIFIITPRFNNDMNEAITHLYTAGNADINVLCIDNSDDDILAIKNIYKDTNVNVWDIKSDTIKQSLDFAIYEYNKGNSQ